MAYSNAGYGLLGELIERESGMTYEEYLTRNIFTPLGMESSYVNFDESKGHTLSMGFKGKKPYEEPDIRDEAAGMIHSNVIDMGNFAIAMINKGELNGKSFVSDQSVDIVETDMLEDITLKTKMKYGFGLFINDLAYTSGENSDTTSVPYFNHGGDTYTYHTDFGYIRDLGVGAVILTNTTTGTKANKVQNLLTLYLKEEKGIDLFDHNPGSEDKNQPQLALYDIQGTYSTVAGLINVDNINKVTFKQGPAKLVLKRDHEESPFAAKAILLGFIPIKIKGQEFNFKKIDDEVLFEVSMEQSGRSMFFGKKEEAKPIPASWTKVMGKYEITGETFETPDKFPFSTDGMKANLKEEDGFIFFELKSSSGMLNLSMAANALDDSTAIGATFGRNSGNTLRILPNGNLYFLGMEFARK